MYVYEYVNMYAYVYANQVHIRNEHQRPDQERRVPYLHIN